MTFPQRTRKSFALWGAALLIILSIATLSFTAYAQSPRCSHAQGRLFNAVAEGEPGRMIGTISGDYRIESFNGTSVPDDSPVTFIWASSHVDGTRGTINFREYAAIDFTEQNGPNGAVLLLVTGGTGQWENASGHIALSGYFHTDESTGRWDYQGEVCVP